LLTFKGKCVVRLSLFVSARQALCLFASTLNSAPKMDLIRVHSSIQQTY
jgi:hypothetical protein